MGGWGAGSLFDGVEECCDACDRPDSAWCCGVVVGEQCAELVSCSCGVFEEFFSCAGDDAVGSWKEFLEWSSEEFVDPCRVKFADSDGVDRVVNGEFEVDEREVWVEW